MRASLRSIMEIHEFAIRWQGKEPSELIWCASRLLCTRLAASVSYSLLYVEIAAARDDFSPVWNVYICKRANLARRTELPLLRHFRYYERYDPHIYITIPRDLTQLAY
jgi:hypothetical protein